MSTDNFKITREKMIKLLNEDLAREYQAIIAYTIYSQTMKGAAYTDIAEELENHAGEELAACDQDRQADRLLRRQPVTTPKPVKTSEKAEDMLRSISRTRRRRSSSTASASAKPTPWASSRSAKFSAKSSCRSRTTSWISPTPSASIRRDSE